MSFNLLTHSSLFTDVYFLLNLIENANYFVFSGTAGSWEEIEDYFTIFNAYGAFVFVFPILFV